MHRVGIIGCGGMGSRHAESFEATGRAKVAAAADVEDKAAEALARRYQARAYRDGLEMLSREELDLVVVTTPTDLHSPYAIAAAERGKHIFCEKPLARTLEQGREMLEAARRHGVKLMVGHVLRWWGEYVAAKRCLDAGQIGKPAVARTVRGGAFPRPPSDWFADYERSGGVIVDLMIHDFDWLRWCFGEVERVYARALTPRNLDHCDYALVVLRFRRGVIAHAQGSWAYPSGFYTRLEVAGDGGLLECDSRSVSPLEIHRRAPAAGGGPGVIVPSSPVAESPYLLEAREFLDYVEGKQEPRVTGEDAYRALEIALAALESARSGQPVSL
jgi:predicted dehydrogenase